jgi:hypothetical protein
VISSHSLGQSFEDWWTSSLAATHASHSQQLEGERDRQMKGTYGPTSKMELLPLSQGCASLRTSKGTYRWDSPQSSAAWKSWVIECRGEYSQRLKSALLTNGNGCSSWPTVSARDWKGCYQTLERKDGKLRGDLLPDAVRIVENGGKRQDGPQGQAKSSINGKLQEFSAKENKLNPRWVETLMGLPVGWTMPSCASPVTIEPMNLDS